MPNAIAHRIGAGAVIGLATAKIESDKGQVSLQPVINAALGASMGTLPDVIEPALNPNHRKFFHSVTALGMVGYGGYKLWKWEPETDFEKLLKGIGLIGCGAYMTHLLMDSTTPKSLPLI